MLYKRQNQLVLFVFLLSFIFSCSNIYKYDKVKTEYKDYICNFKKLPSQYKDINKKQCKLNKPVSLDDAIKITLINNPDIKIAEARIKSAEAFCQSANSSFYPNFSFYNEYLQGNAPSAYLFKRIDQRKLPANVDFNNPGWFENYETGLRGSLNIFNGGKDILSKLVSNTDFEMRKLEKNNLENSLIGGVINLYYDCLAAKDFLNILDDSVNTVKNQLKIVKTKYKLKGVLKSDVLSLEVRLARAKEDVFKWENNLNTQKAALAIIMGLNPDEDIKLINVNKKNIHKNLKYEKYIENALKTRADLSKIKQHVKKAKIALDIANTQYLPTVDLFAKYYYDDPKMSYSSDRDNWTTALMFNWNFFTGFSANAEKQKAKASIYEALAIDHKKKLSAKFEVRKAFLKLKESKTRLDVSQKSVEMAKETLDLVKKQFDGGSVTITRYLETEDAYNFAQVRATSAYYDSKKAYANLQKETGLLLKKYKTKKKETKKKEN